MFVQDGFLYLIVTRHKLTVQVQNTKTNLLKKKQFFYSFIKQTEKQLNQIEFWFTPVQTTKLFFPVLRTLYC
jgi:hypothetical protein